MEEGKAKYLSWVKIRIGEPLTALEVDAEKIVFGAISGYVGYYTLANKKTSYFEHIDEELIRGVARNPVRFTAATRRFISPSETGTFASKTSVGRLRTTRC